MLDATPIASQQVRLLMAAAVLGRDSPRLTLLSDEPGPGRWAIEKTPSPATTPNLPDYTAIAIEPTDPWAWIDRACAVLSRAPAEAIPLSLPDAAYAGPVCEEPR